MAEPSEYKDEAEGASGPAGHPNEFLDLIDELEHYVAEATRVPLTGKAILEEDDVYAILDQIRRSFPAEIRRALEIVGQQEQLLSEAQHRREHMLQEAEIQRDRMLEEAEDRRDRMLAQAQRQAESIVNEARRQASRMVEESEVLREGRREAQETLLAARKAARELQQGADQYAEAVLSRMEKSLADMLSQARQGRQYLRQARQMPPSANLAAEPAAVEAVADAQPQLDSD